VEYRAFGLLDGQHRFLGLGNVGRNQREHLFDLSDSGEAGWFHGATTRCWRLVIRLWHLAANCVIHAASGQEH
jgi:hypothetical protein